MQLSATFFTVNFKEEEHFLDNYVLCRVTNSKPGKTKLEMSILSRFDFSALLCRTLASRGDEGGLSPANSPCRAVTTQTLWARAQQHSKQEIHFQGLKDAKSDLFSGQRKHEGFLEYLRHWSFKP